MPIQPLSAADLNELSDFLDCTSPSGSTMALDTLHGYLTAIAIGPREPALEEWLPGVWSEDGNCLPKFKDVDHEQHIISLIERLLDDIRVNLDDPDYAFSPLIAQQTAGGRQYPDGEMWCYGFMRTVALFSEDWGSFVTSSEGRKLLRPIYLLGADEVTPAEEALTQTATQRAKLTGQISHAVDAIADHFLEERIRTALADAPQCLPNTTTVETPTTSQNQQLCPCGSGDAFNSCCGGVRILH